MINRTFTDRECTLSDSQVIAANPGNSDMAICELCDGVTPLDYCETWNDHLCIYCHMGQLEHGLHQ